VRSWFQSRSLWLMAPGAYEGITGTIKIKETFAAILPQTPGGKCRNDANPTSDVAFFQGEGTVSFN
jgi:hypothetical protein